MLNVNALAVLEQQRLQLVTEVQRQKERLSALRSQSQRLEAEVARLSFQLNQFLNQKDSEAELRSLISIGDLEGVSTLYLFSIVRNYTHQLVSSAQYRVIQASLNDLNTQVQDSEQRLRYLEDSLRLTNRFFEQLNQELVYRRRDEQQRIAARELIYLQMRLDQERLQKIRQATAGFSFRSTTALSMAPLPPRTGFIQPVAGQFTSYFGWREHPILGGQRHHDGVDIAADQGTPVLAAKAGVVRMADWLGGYGLTILIEHEEGYETLYAHLSQLAVRAGESVQQGQLIGAVGSTGLSSGPHLHFEIRRRGQPVDPLPYLNASL